LVLACGFAGGLDPDLKIGDVVFGVQRLESKAQNQLLAAGAKPANFFCADRIATTIAEKKKLREQTGADAVEMESAAIHAVCAERGIPCVTVRVISDTVNEDLPLDFNALAKPDKKSGLRKIVSGHRQIAGENRRVDGVAEENQNSAAKQLAAVLEKIIS